MHIIDYKETGGCAIKYCVVRSIEVLNGQIKAEIVFTPSYDLDDCCQYSACQGFIEGHGKGFTEGRNGASTGARVFVPWGLYPDNDFQRDAFDQTTIKELALEIAGDAGDIAVGE